MVPKIDYRNFYESSIYVERRDLPPVENVILEEMLTKKLLKVLYEAIFSVYYYILVNETEIYGTHFRTCYYEAVLVLVIVPVLFLLKHSIH